jgi:hypothetical protein
MEVYIVASKSSVGIEQIFVEDMLISMRFNC